LVTSEILEKYNKDFIIELIVNLVGTLEKDLLEVKLNINTQCRIAATFFIDQLSNPPNEEFY
jgi:actin related protein 2/3 complex subunit 4